MEKTGLRKAHAGKMRLFVLGEILAFGFLTALQFVSFKENTVAFILVLVAMHVGIVCFILSKRLYKTNLDLKRFYRVEYILLACFLPFLALTIIGVVIPRPLKLGLIFALVAVAVIVSIINDVRLYKFLKSSQED